MLNCSKENRESTKIKIPKMSWDNHCQNLDISPIQGWTLLETRQVGTIIVGMFEGRWKLESYHWSWNNRMIFMRISIQLEKDLSNFIFEFPSLNCRNSRFF